MSALVFSAIACVGLLRIDRAGRGGSAAQHDDTGRKEGNIESGRCRDRAGRGAPLGRGTDAHQLRQPPRGRSRVLDPPTCSRWSSRCPTADTTPTSRGARFTPAHSPKSSAAFRRSIGAAQVTPLTGNNWTTAVAARGPAARGRARRLKSAGRWRRAATSRRCEFPFAPAASSNLVTQPGRPSSSSASRRPNRVPRGRNSRRTPHQPRRHGSRDRRRRRRHPAGIARLTIRGRTCISRSIGKVFLPPTLFIRTTGDPETVCQCAQRFAGSNQTRRSSGRVRWHGLRPNLRPRPGSPHACWRGSP